MPFPLTGSPLSATGVTLHGEGSEFPAPISFTATHTWGDEPHTQYSVMTRTMHSGVVSIVGEDLDSVVELMVEGTVERSWNGLGGVIYVPSFPQLNRHWTTFPTAQ